MLADERIAEYQRLYRNRFGREISRERALEQATKLTRMMELIYQPLTDDDYRLLARRRAELGSDGGSAG